MRLKGLTIFGVSFIALSAWAELDLSTLVGESIHTFASPQPQINEVCVVPEHLPGGDYRTRDREKELELCRYSFWSEETAICPKVSGTNPGVEIYKLMPGVSRKDFSSQECPKKSKERDKTLVKKLGKFKQSMSCSYTPSILGYYHLSRMLGGAGNVPVAVARTMSKEEHLKLAKFGYRYAKKYPEFPLLKSTWGTYLFLHNNLMSQESRTVRKYRPRVFSDDYEQIYGALQPRVKGNEDYTELFILDGYEEYAKKEVIKKLEKKEYISEDLAFGDLLQMKDVSDMLILDYIMGQRDRIRNIEYQNFIYYLDVEGVSHSRRQKSSTESEIIAQGGTDLHFVRRMILRDNDCGVVKGNSTKKSGILKKLHHVSAKTYYALLRLDKRFEDPQFRRRLKDTVLFTESDLESTHRLVGEVVDLLKSKCERRELFLDLNPKAFLAGEKPGDIFRCEN